MTKAGADVVGAPVYLFTPSGTYLGRSENTDASGVAEFMLPGQQYKFRVDHEGSQYWSDVVTIISYEENDIELNLDLLALDLTNNPNPVRFDGVPPKPEPQKAVVALLGSLPGFLVDSAYAQAGTEKTYFFINDHLGTPQKVIDETGVVVWSADYRPFGEANVTVNTLENNFRFPGQYYDQETGLHYNWHRYYHPGIGKYLRSDPLGLARDFHLFSYALGNPVNWFDPWGLFCQIEYGTPAPGGEPLGMRYEERKIGYWNAVMRKVAWELFLVRFGKRPIPPVPPLFEYTIEHTILQKLRVYIEYFEVCYDDCTGKELSREFLGKGDTGRTEEVILKRWEESVRL